ncbi:MAG: SDR family NAD(P)-dependent oxidoreductase [Waterburya sp.]
MVILITGASSGIGRKLVLYYLNQGHTVAAVARCKEKLAELYQESQSQLGTLKIYPADVTDKGRMAEVITVIEKDLGFLDLAIANAGIANQQLTANLDLEAFEQLMQTNVIGVFNTLVPTVKAMMQRGRGQIVTISSLAAFHPIPRLSTYCASKVALNYQLAGLYWTLKPHGIKVTTICPGFIETEMTVKEQVPMYWCMDVNKAVEKIAKAIAQKRRLYCFPFRQYQLIKLLGILPNVIQGFVFNILIEKGFPLPKFSNS